MIKAVQEHLKMKECELHFIIEATNVAILFSIYFIYHNYITLSCQSFDVVRCIFCIYTTMMPDIPPAGVKRHAPHLEGLMLYLEWEGLATRD